VHPIKISSTPKKEWASRNALVCPFCRQHVSLDTLDDVQDVYATGKHLLLGHRRCPNPACEGHIFVVTNQFGYVVKSYPPSAVAFDRDSIPEAVLAAFDEAVVCHANECYVASAIMIRKTLEEICADRGAEGKDLKARIDALKDVVILPPDFLTGMHDLRALGNDGAHVELKTFPRVSRKETLTAIQVTKVLLAGVYQFASMMTMMNTLKGSADSGDDEDSTKSSFDSPSHGSADGGAGYIRNH